MNNNKKAMDIQMQSIEKLLENLKDINEHAIVAQSQIAHLYKSTYDTFVNSVKDLRLQIELQNQNDGVLIDYKTFSDIVNALSIASNYNVISNDFVNKIISIGNIKPDNNNVSENEKSCKSCSVCNCSEDKDEEKVNPIYMDYIEGIIKALQHASKNK